MPRAPRMHLILTCRPSSSFTRFAAVPAFWRNPVLGCTVCSCLVSNLFSFTASISCSPRHAGLHQLCSCAGPGQAPCGGVDGLWGPAHAVGAARQSSRLLPEGCCPGLTSHSRGEPEAGCSTGYSRSAPPFYRFSHTAQQQLSVTTGQRIVTVTVNSDWHLPSTRPGSATPVSKGHR